MSLEQVRAVLGSPTRSVPMADEQTLYVFSGAGLSVTVFDSTAKSISALSGRWHLTEGIRVGDPLQKVKSKLGTPGRDGGWHVWYPGLYFESQNGVITSISVR
jgi:hypothetical protein